MKKHLSACLLACCVLLGGCAARLEPEQLLTQSDAEVSTSLGGADDAVDGVYWS